MSEKLENEMVFESIAAEPKSGGISKKASIAVSSIGVLVLKDAIDFKVAVIVGIIAIVGIVCQTMLDGGILKRWAK